MHSLYFSLSSSTLGDGLTPAQVIEAAIKDGDFNDPSAGIVMDTVNIDDGLDCEEGQELNSNNACGKKCTTVISI